MSDNASGHAGQGLALPCVVTVTCRKRPVKVQSTAGFDRAEAACYPLERDIDPVAEVDHELHQNTVSRVPELIARKLSLSSWAWMALSMAATCFIFPRGTTENTLR